MVRFKGDFVWADVQLGPSQVSALRISEESALERLKCTVYVVKAIRAWIQRPYKQGVRISGGWIREVPLQYIIVYCI